MIHRPRSHQDHRDLDRSIPFCRQLRVADSRGPGDWRLDDPEWAHRAPHRVARGSGAKTKDGMGSGSIALTGDDSARSRIGHDGSSRSASAGSPLPPGAVLFGGPFRQTLTRSPLGTTVPWRTSPFVFISGGRHLARGSRAAGSRVGYPLPPVGTACRCGACARKGHRRPEPAETMDSRWRAGTGIDRLPRGSIGKGTLRAWPAGIFQTHRGDIP